MTQQKSGAALLTLQLTPIYKEMYIEQHLFGKFFA
jgi:hypothetical protein